jgi:hypothetical protein
MPTTATVGARITVILSTRFFEYVLFCEYGNALIEEGLNVSDWNLLYTKTQQRLKNKLASRDFRS